MGLDHKQNNRVVGVGVTARGVVAVLMLVLAWLATGSTVSAQSELPGNDPAAWLDEASVQARRISGVGDELTYALQTKGALLAHIAAVQRDLGEDAAASENETIVRLCLRALAHDGEDGWVRAAQVWAAHDRDNETQAASQLERITRPTEREFVVWVMRGAKTSEEPNIVALGTGFQKQLLQVERHEWVRSNARSVAAHGTGQDVQAWVGGLDDPAERAWASLGVAQGLREAASRSTRLAISESVEPTLAEPTAKAAGESSAGSEPVSSEASQSDPQSSPDLVISAAEEPSASGESVAASAPTPAANIEPMLTEVEPAPEPAVVVEAHETLAAVGAEPDSPVAPAEVVKSVTPAEPIAVAKAQVSETVLTETKEVASTREEATVLEVPEVVPEEVAAAEPEPVIGIEPALTGVVAEPEAVAGDAADSNSLAEVTTAELLPPAVVPVVPDLSVLADPPKVMTTEVSPGVFDVEFTTTKGTFTVRVYRDWAPRAAERFHDLVVAGFYHNQRFFRVVPGFVVQWGIHGFPEVAAAWRAQTLVDEPRVQPNRRGTVAFAAATQPNTRATQVFINLADNAFLNDLGFVPFGEIVAGMDVVESLFAEHGENPSEQQREIQLQGNAFLDAEFPGLDSVVSTEVQPVISSD